MRVGTYLTPTSGDLDGALTAVRATRDAGLSSTWFAQLMSWDALTLAALAGRAVPDLELGTAVLRMPATHPLALAGQALSVQAATGGRLTLGLGVGHRQIVEGQYGGSFEHPARYAREYLRILLPLLRGESVEFRGTMLAGAGAVDLPAPAPSVLLAALGPAMLRVAGELADGTVTTWAGPAVLGEHIVPGLVRAAVAAGRPAPRVVATTIAAVTAHPDELRGALAGFAAPAAGFASYRRLLDLQGLTGLEQTAVLGDEAEVAAALRRFADAGATDLVVGVVGDESEQDRTRKLLAQL
jgi:F420-dependent oxidoreductase-like protein